jgi:outer membrane protein with beta-barrel domain
LQIADCKLQIADLSLQSAFAICRFGGNRSAVNLTINRQSEIDTLEFQRRRIVRTFAGLVTACVLLSAGTVSAQTAVGAGKLEATLTPAGWLSVAAADTVAEPGFSQYVFGGAFAVNWSMLGLEGEIFLAPGRSQDLQYGSPPTTIDGSPMVVMDSVTLVVPLIGNNHLVVPYGAAGIGEFTLMRTSDNVTQPDTETFTTGYFGGGVKWYRSSRWGIRVDYRYAAVRSKLHSPGDFFGEELRKANRLYGALTVNLLSR